jgi:hypothetical protein
MNLDSTARAASDLRSDELPALQSQRTIQRILSAASGDLMFAGKTIGKAAKPRVYPGLQAGRMTG